MAIRKRANAVTVEGHLARKPHQTKGAVYCTLTDDLGFTWELAALPFAKGTAKALLESKAGDLVVVKGTVTYKDRGYGYLPTVALTSVLNVDVDLAEHAEALANA